MALGCPQVAASAPEGVGRTLNSTDSAGLGTRDAFASFPGCVAWGAFHVTFSFRVLRVPPSPEGAPESCGRPGGKPSCASSPAGQTRSSGGRCGRDLLLFSCPLPVPTIPHPVLALGTSLPPF